jgi:hypothetical protein
MATNAEDLPPEFLDTVEGDNLFDIVHPTRGARRRRRDSWGAGSAGKVTTLGCRGIEPERPGRIKWVLVGDVSGRGSPSSEQTGAAIRLERRTTATPWK